MFNDFTLENSVEKKEKQLRELAISIEALDMQVAEMMAELKVTRKQLSMFLSNPENFTPENWEELQKQKKNLELKLQRDLAQIRNPKEAEKKLKQSNVAPHWLFVR